MNFLIIRGFFRFQLKQFVIILHDAKIFAKSNINKRMAENIFPITYQSLLPGCTIHYPLIHCSTKKVTHTQANLQLKAAGLLKHV